MASPAVAGDADPSDPGAGTAIITQPAPSSSPYEQEVGLLMSDGLSADEASAIAAEDAAAVLAAAVPACVTARYENPFGPYQNVYVTNGCAVSVRVKVIWAFADDSACHTVGAGDTWKEHHFNQTIRDRWDGLKSC